MIFVPLVTHFDVRNIWNVVRQEEPGKHVPIQEASNPEEIRICVPGSQKHHDTMAAAAQPAPLQRRGSPSAVIPAGFPCLYTAFSDLPVQLFLQWHSNNSPTQMHGQSYESFCCYNSGNSKLLITLLALAQRNLSSLQSGHNTWACYMRGWRGRATHIAGLTTLLAGLATAERGCVFTKEQGKLTVPLFPL